MAHLLEVKQLTTVFESDFGTTTAADHVSFHIDPGEVVALVGESGCGKSITNLSIMGLLSRSGKVIEGEALFEGKDLLAMNEKELDQVRGNHLSMVFQDPLTSLNPVFSIGTQITESIRTHLHLPKKEAAKRAVEILKKVGMPDPEGMMKKYPHTLSGGLRQRAMIAMALSCDPKLLIADEPTTALDVTIQAQIMELLKKLQKESGMAVILITHDIGLVAEMADRVMVMYAGQIVEEAPMKELFQNPRHPYTRALLDTVPTIKDQESRILKAIPGMVPERYDHITGCRFADRCPFKQPECEKEIDNVEFPMENSNEKMGKHLVRCVIKEGIIHE